MRSQKLVPSSSYPDGAIICAIDQSCDSIRNFITKSKPTLQSRNEIKPITKERKEPENPIQKLK